MNFVCKLLTFESLIVNVYIYICTLCRKILVLLFLVLKKKLVHNQLSNSINYANCRQLFICTAKYNAKLGIIFNLLIIGRKLC